MKRITIAFIALIFIALSCTKADKAERLSVRKGEITITADESLKFIAKAQVNAYQASYPDAVINLIYAPEQQAIGLMLNDSADIAIVSRGLDATEQKYYTSRNMEYQPARMAIDAIALVVSPDSELDSISTSDLASILNDTDSTKLKLVFDHSSSSTLNYMLDKFEIKDIKNNRIFTANGTENIFDVVEERKNTIGIIGYNWISDVDDPRAKAIRDRVKILKVGEKNKPTVKPRLFTIQNKTYPLVKTVYLHTTQDRWGVAKGFVRFACTQLGQLVVEKMDLQPFYRIPKNYDMSSTPDIITVE